MFMDAAFGAVHTAIGFLEIKLSAHHADFSTNSNLTAEQVVNYLCQQCEASLQFLQSLCQQKMFRERLLRNKVFQLEPHFFFFFLQFMCLEQSQMLGAVSFMFSVIYGGQ
jgi:hypothetical protein